MLGDSQAALISHPLSLPTPFQQNLFPETAYDNYLINKAKIISEIKEHRLRSMVGESMDIIWRKIAQGGEFTEWDMAICVLLKRLSQAGSDFELSQVIREFLNNHAQDFYSEC